MPRPPTNRHLQKKGKKPREVKDLSSPLEGKSWWEWEGDRKEEAEAEAEEGGDKNKRPRMVLSEALLFLRLDQERGMSLGCIEYLFIGTLML